MAVEVSTTYNRTFVSETIFLTHNMCFILCVRRKQTTHIQNYRVWILIVSWHYWCTMSVKSKLLPGAKRSIWGYICGFTDHCTAVGWWGKKTLSYEDLETETSMMKEAFGVAVSWKRRSALLVKTLICPQHLKQFVSLRHTQVSQRTYKSLFSAQRP